jgi:hypothetical protein
MNELQNLMKSIPSPVLEQTIQAIQNDPITYVKDFLNDPSSRVMFDEVFSLQK